MKNALILLPSYGGLVGHHVVSLAHSGCETLSTFGAPIDQARCYLIAEALKTEKDIFVFIDADISFERSDIEKVIDDCDRTKAIVSGCYVLKNDSNKIVAMVAPGTQTARDDGLFPALRVGMGFCAIHREALDIIGQHLETLICDMPTRAGEQTLVRPYFLPMVYEGAYQGEDYSFCIRAEKAGVPIFLNTTILLTHWGLRGYRLKT